MCGSGAGPDMGATCNTLVAAGPCVTPLFALGTPPPATGGAIAAGTYNLTAETVYGTADGGLPSTRREVVAVSNVTATSLAFDLSSLSGAQTTRISAAGTISGSTITYDFTCLGTIDAEIPGGTEGFTVAGTTLTIVRSPNGGTVVDVYAKAP